MATVCVFGAGAFGTALALYHQRLGHGARVWAFDDGLPEQVAREGENRAYLPDVKLPSEILFTNDPEEARAGADLVLLAVPSAHMRAVAKTVRPLLGDVGVVSLAKGIEAGTHAFMNQVLEEELPEHRDRLCFLSGPSFAREIAKGLPADAALASHDITVARSVQAIMHSAAFRIYTSNDVVGVELGGALKNVVAVACGAADGLGFGASGRASLMTRGLAEITRLGVALGANPLTFLGLAGVGDLILTCTGDLSRNRQLGKRLAAGEKASDIVGGQKAVAEGYVTAKPVYELAQKMNVDMPISTAVYRVLYEGQDLLTAAQGLMNREMKDELHGIFPLKGQ
ncbi:MAG: NAD(P)-dependent glycerol-3-phosphate dehydrogenase [Deltaproteobacteria bacterium]|nr:NAD(P)-dependent glycerol-3-phosphate dehydrogenase [Deltaproteobacteria bacterium]